MTVYPRPVQGRVFVAHIKRVLFHERVEVLRIFELQRNALLPEQEPFHFLRVDQEPIVRVRQKRSCQDLEFLVEDVDIVVGPTGFQLRVNDFTKGRVQVNRSNKQVRVHRHNEPILGALEFPHGNHGGVQVGV